MIRFLCAFDPPENLCKIYDFLGNIKKNNIIIWHINNHPGKNNKMNKLTIGFLLILMMFGHNYVLNQPQVLQ